MEKERLVWEESGSRWTETGEVSGFVVIYNKTLRALGEAGNLQNSESCVKIEDGAEEHG